MSDYDQFFKSLEFQLNRASRYDEYRHILAVAKVHAVEEMQRHDRPLPSSTFKQILDQNVPPEILAEVKEESEFFHILLNG